MASNRAYGIVVSSQKGGVGKTTIAVNLATALREEGYRVLLIDADYSNPTVGFHLGLESANIGIRAVLGNKARLENAIVIHNPTGLHVLPGEITGRAFDFKFNQLYNIYSQLVSTSYDFIVTDMAPGPLPVDVFEQFKAVETLEILVLLTPEMSACVSAVRLAHIYDKMDIKRSFVVNRVRNRRYELSISEIEDVCRERMMAALPEDENVPISIAEHIPAYLISPRCAFSRGVRELSRRYASRTGSMREKEEGRGVLDYILRLLRIRR